MDINEMNKDDLRKRNRELRHKMMVRQTEARLKDEARKAEADKKAEADAVKKTPVPELILTMLKRLKRIDPWNGVAAMDPKQAVMVSYYKLRQIGMEELRIVANSAHAWVEFLYDEKWWVFDPISVRKRNLGLPIKKKSEVDEPEYLVFSRSFKTIDSYLDTYGDDDAIYLDKDEAKILAMEDKGFGSINKINYH